MLHPDGQYEPSIIPKLVEPIVRGEADLVLGSRFLIPGGAIAGGMPRWKWAGQPRADDAREPADGHRPLRASHRLSRVLARAAAVGPFLRNSLDFAFDSELLMQAAYFGFRFHEVPCQTSYFDEASSVSLRQGIVYGVKTLWAGCRLVLHRRRLALAQVHALMCS